MVHLELTVLVQTDRDLSMTQYTQFQSVASHANVFQCASLVVSHAKGFEKVLFVPGLPSHSDHNSLKCESLADSRMTTVHTFLKTNKCRLRGFTQSKDVKCYAEQ